MKHISENRMLSYVSSDCNKSTENPEKQMVTTGRGEVTSRTIHHLESEARQNVQERIAEPQSTLSTREANKLVEIYNAKYGTITSDGVLVQLRGAPPLDLSGITHLSHDVADILATCIGDLKLNGLQAVSIDVARALSRHRAWLHLNGVKELGAHEARELTGHKSLLELNGLETLTAETAVALSAQQSILRLNGLQDLSMETARALSVHSGTILELNGLKKLHHEIAQALSNYPGILHLDGIEDLDEGGAAGLGACAACSVWLSGLKSMDAPTMRNLSEYCGYLILGLRKIDSPQLAHALIQSNAKAIRLYDVENLSIEAATVLASSNVVLSFSRERLPRGMTDILQANNKCEV